MASSKMRGAFKARGSAVLWEPDNDHTVVLADLEDGRRHDVQAGREVVFAGTKAEALAKDLNAAVESFMSNEFADDELTDEQEEFLKSLAPDERDRVAKALLKMLQEGSTNDAS